MQLFSVHAISWLLSIVSYSSSLHVRDVQPRHLVQRSSVASDTDSVRFATITTDTGAFAPGHRDFSHYTNPGLCRAAARWVRAVAQRSLSAQISRDTLLRDDTTGVGKSTSVARSCGTHFTLAHTPSKELRNLFDLALYEQNDSLSLAVLASLVAQATTAEERAFDWTDATRAYLEYGRVTAAETLTRQLDSQGPSLRTVQMALHDQLRSYYSDRGDTTRTREEAEEEIAQGRKRVAHEPSYTYVLEGYRDLIRLAISNAPDSLPVIAQRAQADLSQFTPADQAGLLDRDRGAWSTFSRDTVLSRLAPLWYAYIRYGGGTPAPRLHADIWLPLQGSGNDTIRPAPGKVNLICRGGYPTGDRFYVFGRGQQSGYMLAAHLRRWLSMYGDKGLVITMVRPAPGYYISDEDAKLFRSSAEEANMWRWYDQTYEQVPVTVAVQSQYDQWLPAPDGRRLTESDIQFDQYLTRKNETGAQADPGACTIISRDGVILYTGQGDGYSYTGSPYLGAQVGEHNIYDTILQWLFAHPQAQSTYISRSSRVIP